jgi:hypothetical protein
MSGSQQKNLRIFKSVCGEGDMQNVVVVMTMWNRLGDCQEGERREIELKQCYWGDMMAEGCMVKRFQDTYQSAWDIIGRFEKTASGEDMHRVQGVEKRVAQMKAELSRSVGALNTSFFRRVRSIFGKR